MVRRQHVRQRLVLLAIVVVAGLTTSNIVAQDATTTDASVAEQTEDESPETKPPVISDEHRKENLVSILLMLLGGVGIMGVALVGMTMIWGAHARRIARQTDHPPTQQDELWYMRRPPPEDTQVDPPAGEEDGTSTPDRETET